MAHRLLFKCAVVAVFVASVLVAPVVAQQVARVYGTVSDGTFLPVLVDSTGQLIVSLSGGTVSPSTIHAGDGTLAAPSYSFASEPGTGWYRSGTQQISAAFAGGEYFRIGTTTVSMLTDNYALRWGASADVSLSRGAANVLTLGANQSMGFGAVPFLTRTAPTVTSAGTSPTIATNGTVTGRVNVGTGGVATTVVVAMPTATTGWNCQLENLTATAANRANQRVAQQSSTTTSFTAQNQTISTGAALAFTASDSVSYICFAY